MGIKKNLAFMSKIIDYGMKNLPSKVDSRKRFRDYGNRMFNHGLIQGARRISNYHPGADTGIIRGDWINSTKSITSVISEDFQKICARAENAYRTDAVTKRVISILASFIVGEGNQPTPSVRMNNGEMVEGVNNQLSSDWERFNDEGIRNGTMHLTMYQGQWLKCVTMLTYGSVIQNLIRSRKGSLLPFSFQVLKPTRLDFSKDNYLNSNSKEIDVSNKILHGMKLNKYGEALGYYFDGENFMRNADNIDLTFFPIETEQYLGLSWLTPILPAVHDRQQLLSDKLKISRIAAKLGIQMPRNLQEGIEGLTETSDTGESYLDLDFQGLFFSDGVVTTIPITDPIADTFEPLIKMTMQEIAMGAGFSYQRLTSDLQDANFSGARTNTIADKKFFNQLFRFFVKSSHQLDWNRFVEWEAFVGRLEKHGVSYSKYLDNPWYYNQCYWLPRSGEDWVDPLKDAQALILMYKTGQITYQQLCSMAGKNYKSIIKQLAKEREEITAAGLEHMLPENISTSAKTSNTNQKTEEVVDED